jgi:hypothetical protein
LYEKRRQSASTVFAKGDVLSAADEDIFYIYQLIMEKKYRQGALIP